MLKPICIGLAVLLGLGGAANGVFMLAGFFSTKEGGMGIGLTICQSIIAAHGGTIAASNPFGGGAEFRVAILLEPASAEVVITDAPPDGGARDTIRGYARPSTSWAVDGQAAPS